MIYAATVEQCKYRHADRSVGRDRKMKTSPYAGICYSIILLGALLVIHPTAAQAVALNHNEDINGDINNNVFAFDLGANIISGNTSKERERFLDGSSATISTDLDNFFFSTLNGQKISSILYEFSNIQLINASSNLGSDFSIKVGFGEDPLALQTVIVSNESSPVLMFDSTIFPLQADDLLWEHNHRFSSGGVVGLNGGSWDYTITFNVAEAGKVDEPSVLALFGIGLLGLGEMRRRRKKAA
mgnify:CR=1 FL=1